MPPWTTEYEFVCREMNLNQIRPLSFKCHSVASMQAEYSKPLSGAIKGRVVCVAHVAIISPKNT